MNTFLFCFAERTDTGSATSYAHFRSSSLAEQRFQALSTINKTLLHKRSSSFETGRSRTLSVDNGEGDDVFNCPRNSDISYANSQVSSLRSYSQTWSSDQASTSDGTTYFSSENQVTFCSICFKMFLTF